MHSLGNCGKVRVPRESSGRLMKTLVRLFFIDIQLNCHPIGTTWLVTRNLTGKRTPPPKKNNKKINKPREGYISYWHNPEYPLDNKVIPIGATMVCGYM